MVHNYVISDECLTNSAVIPPTYNIRVVAGALCKYSVLYPTFAWMDQRVLLVYSIELWLRDAIERVVLLISRKSILVKC